jgi:hypothetical protein
LNVYPYEDETLHFADGRLMLRDVNGSDNSTAMNMLLPSTTLSPTPRPPASSDLATPRPHRGHRGTRPWPARSTQHAIVHEERVMDHVLAAHAAYR